MKNNEWNDMTSSKTLTGLKRNVEAYIRKSEQFKPVSAILRERDRIVKITSLRDNDYVRISWRDERGKISRQEHLLQSAYRGNSHFVVHNEHNATILNKIQKMNERIEKLHRQRNELRKQYTEPVTKDTLVGKNKEVKK